MTLNRRRFERFALPAAYTAVAVRPMAGRRSLNGHAYDISESGVRFELDRALPLGAAVEIKITLPGPEETERTVAARARVIWVEQDEEEPGPVRMAAAFHGLEAADRERLLAALSSGRYARAA